MMRVVLAVVAAALGVVCGCAPAPERVAAGGGGGGAVATPLERSIVLLQEEARSKDPATHANAIEALQPCPDARADEAIEQGLHDPEWVVRFASAMAAGKRKNARLLPVVRMMAASDVNESVRVGALYAMHRMGENRYANVLGAMLRSRDPATRANTAFVIGLIGDKGMIPVLRSQGNEEDSRVKFEITAAMARLGDAVRRILSRRWRFRNLRRTSGMRWRSVRSCHRIWRRMRWCWGCRSRRIRRRRCRI